MTISPHDIEIKDSIADAFGRTFKVLRVSLTNTCNLACTYCVDPTVSRNKKTVDHKRALSNEEYVQIIRVLHKVLDLDTVRLTGGEPTLYKELVPLISGIKELGIDKIKMTSNGTLLDSKAADLKGAGLSDVNISLDALDADVSTKINKRQNLSRILKGIEQSAEVGIQVKINCVVMKGVNDGQVLKLFAFCKDRNIPIRFLELMQMGHLYHNFEQYYFSEEEILKLIAGAYDFYSLPREPNATAKYWITTDQYKFGVISNASDPFCNDCNRLRLDSYGNIYGCLSDNHPISLLDCLQDEQEVKQRLLQALQQKKAKFSGSELSMLYIGG